MCPIVTYMFCLIGKGRGVFRIDGIWLNKHQVELSDPHNRIIVHFEVECRTDSNVLLCRNLMQFSFQMLFIIGLS